MALFEVGLKTLLEAQAFTSAGGTALTWFLAMEEDEPDYAATILPEPGGPPTRTVGEFPAFTIRVRAATGEEANITMRRIFQYLQERSIIEDSTAGIPPVARIRAAGGPVQLGRDTATAKGRWNVQQSFDAILQQVDQLA